ncbi:MAG TPA: hypothetical protein VJY62_22765 [Bacteroidia bacterium]|nr:hypothetical protein [Bacteroidia bacterium]
MVIRFFKSRQPLVYVVFVVIALAAWSAGYPGFTIESRSSMPFYNLLLKLISPDHKFIYFLLGLSLILSQTIHLNFICNKHEVLYRNSFLPGLFYLLLSVSIPQFISFHPVLIVNSILIFTLNKIFRLYKNDTPLAWDFDSCVLLSFMTLFYLPAVIFLLLYAVSLIILRPFSWRDWVVGLMGFLTPVFFVLLFYFLNDTFGEIKHFIHTTEISRKFNIKNAVPGGYPFTIIWVSAVFILSLLKIRLNFLKNTAKTRSYQLIILFLVIISLLMIIFTPSEMLFRFSILCIPLSIIVAYYFLTTKKAWLTDPVLYLLVAFIIYNYISIK